MGEVLSGKKIQLMVVALIAAMAMSFAMLGAQQVAYAADDLQAGSMLTIQNNAEEPQPPAKGTEVEAGKGATAADYTVTNAKSNTVSYTAPATKTAKVTVPATVKVNGKTYKVTSIDTGAFKGNKQVTTLTVGKNVKTIGANAFANCTKLSKLTLGAGVTKIGANAFKGAKKLKTLTISSKNLKKAGVKGALKGSSVKTIVVPKAKVKAYKKIFTKANCGKKVTVKAK